MTNEAGQYLVVALEPGVYSVTFTLAGFRTVVREGVKLSTGFTANIDTQLPVGSVAETVTVTGASPVVDVRSVEQRQVMSRDVMDDDRVHVGDREGGPAPVVTRSPPTPRQGRGVGPGISAILDDVKRRRESTLVPRPRQALDGAQYGGTQPTDISRINRRILLAPTLPMHRGKKT